ncbi:hypothetical protein [Streptomyces naganishii]|uniref:Methionyl-tRNA formyltransferase n=1 Tax=Streptomyces naganishii JCM 4654 TaxID=1306179 RepID=A0A919CV79_9ACTN|nr:hypothetical protein [Streptomyces naganishii]GHD89408.1 hypothetical protein GCM10010508_30280 [Streptomyces naganishii JCM 4654]
MALIREFQQVSSDTQKLHGPVTCGYRTFTVNGRRVLQLDTYGSEERQIHGKISQSIQLDDDAARNLLRVLQEAFPGLHP